ncbi:MAG: hypothetical protein HKN42_14730 [Granulosicoccus sp.]|nr:hypothetical protein [Granulosicoccus sp.]
MLIRTCASDVHGSCITAVLGCRQAVLRFAIALLFIPGLSGCDFVYFHYSNCGYYDGPDFEKEWLIQPVLNQEYAEQVQISFDEDRHIVGYDYHIEFSGSLPPGLSYYQDQNTIYFQGAAISQGSFSFTISVYVRYGIHGGNYHVRNCSFRTAQNYLLIVEPI